MSAFGDAGTVVRFVWQHPANRKQRLRQIGRAARFQLRGRLLGRRTLTPIGDHSRMWAELHYTASSSVLYANPPDWAEMQFWRRHLGQGDLFVDVGANVGSYALWALDLGALVIAVEPDEDARTRLEENIALNGYGAEVRPVALGSAPGLLRFTSGRGTTNQLVAFEDQVEGSVEVEVSTLDDLLGDRVAAGVKIDVEGAEQLVLKGASRALQDRRVSLFQLEWNARSEQLLGTDRRPVAELLEGAGYELGRPGADGSWAPLDDVSYGADVFARPV
jgi:FkbM family methyltransferase